MYSYVFRIRQNAYIMYINTHPYPKKKTISSQPPSSKLLKFNIRVCSSHWPCFTLSLRYSSVFRVAITSTHLTAMGRIWYFVCVGQWWYFHPWLPALVGGVRMFVSVTHTASAINGCFSCFDFRNSWAVTVCIWFFKCLSCFACV